MPVHLQIVEDVVDVARAASQHVCAQVRERSDAVLGLAYEERIRALGGVDLWLLGIGSNGHIAFNEPGSSCDSRTRCVKLMAETIADNSRLFAASTEVPRRAFTVGVGTILEARRVLLLATGAHKARAVAAALQGDQGTHCPASFLREHAHCTFVIDRPAASMLES